MAAAIERESVGDSIVKVTRVRNGSTVEEQLGGCYLWTYGKFVQEVHKQSLPVLQKQEQVPTRGDSSIMGHSSQVGGIGTKLGVLVAN